MLFHVVVVAIIVVVAVIIPLVFVVVVPLVVVVVPLVVAVVPLVVVVCGCVGVWVWVCVLFPIFPMLRSSAHGFVPANVCVVFGGGGG